MGMSAGSSGDAAPYINVTPLIDVLLVLLVIFMVISPLKPSKFEAKIPAEPKEEDKDVPVKPNPLTLVVALDKNGGITLNKEDMGGIADTSALTNRLSQVFKDREREGAFRQGTNEIEKTVFVKAPRSIRYEEVVKAIDGAKIAGAQPIGLQIDDLSD